MTHTQSNPADVEPGKHAPVPISREGLLIEALRTANRMGGLLNDIAAWGHEQMEEVGTKHQEAALERLGDLLIRRFSDCSAVHLFIAADNLRVDLPPDLHGDEPCDDGVDDDEQKVE